MSSRERRGPADDLDSLIRESLLERAGGRYPRPAMRRALLQRAARQQRRLGWRLPSVHLRLLRPDPARFAPHAAFNHMLYVQALFGPRLGWTCFSSLMR
jgi:hypothetical protein